MSFALASFRGAGIPTSYQKVDSMETIRAYYNEIDPFCCNWISNLMDAGLITPGVIDDRSIKEVRPDDLAGFQRIHMFAGIAGWDYALNLARWGSREVWTGSAPCQPFSSAGKGLGTADPRHLWPDFYRLIRECRPATVFGEQVRGAVRRGWLDGCFDDLERADYACGAAVIGAWAVGANHQRDRLWFAADAEWDKQRGEESRCRADRRVGRIEQPVPWNEPWPSALSRLRVLGDGLSRRVGATDAARNAIVPQAAAEFIAAYLETKDPHP